MANVDYVKLIPPPPEGLLDFAKKYLNDGYLIHHKSHRYDPLTGMKEPVAKVMCTACGHKLNAGWVADIGTYTRRYGIMINGEKHFDYEQFTCPECGRTLRIKSVTAWYSDSIKDGVTIQSYDRIEDKFTVLDWRVTRHTYKNGTVSFDIDIEDAYIFEKKRCYDVRNHKYWWYYNSGQIEQLARFQPEKNLPSAIFPPEDDFILGTTMENSRLDKFLKITKENRVVQYLRIYQEKRNIETLMDLGLGEWLLPEIEKLPYHSPRTTLPELNWKEKSPYKILGLDRNELKLIKDSGIDYTTAENMKYLRSKGYPISHTLIELVKKVGYRDVERILREERPLMKTLKYLAKQDRNFYYLEDYWRMARKLGLDLDNPVIKWPKDLIAKHDEVNEKVKWLEQPDLMQKFADMAAAMSETFEKDGICIRIAQREAELIREGQTLHHCVGGYGKNHIQGRSIFFVRRADEPQTPWYTLQVNLKTGEKIQLHGYENDRNTPIPQEVHDFVNYWLRNIFQPFDVDKMEFIKQDKKKTA